MTSAQIREQVEKVARDSYAIEAAFRNKHAEMAMYVMLTALCRTQIEMLRILEREYGE